MKVTKDNTTTPGFLTEPEEDESELALVSTVSYDERASLPEVKNTDAIYATIAFPALAVILGAMCWNQRKAFRKQTSDDFLSI